MTTQLMRAGALALAIVVSAAAGYRLGTGAWPSFDAVDAGRETPPAMPTAARSNSELPMAAPRPAGKETAGTRNLLYYRNPMGLPDTSPVPKKDWMGMDYIAVYEGDEPEDTSTVKVSLEKVQRSGVRSEAVAMKSMIQPLRVPGIAKPDERSLRKITLRADGFIEKLYANEHGKEVKAGEPLFRIFSQEMQRALIDYRLSGKDTAGRTTLIPAEQRLHTFDIPQAAIDDARRSAALPTSFDWPSPVSGVIMEKKAVEGQMAKMGEELFLIGSLANVWVIADVPEQDAASVKIGATATINFRGLPGETFTGKVTFILHELDHVARTAKVRIEVKNPDYRIKHEMYAEVDIAAGAGEAQRLVVPSSAVIDSGTRQVVIIDKGEGRFEPRPIIPGLRADGMVEVKKGLVAGERVVVAANFLIDAESNIKAALEAFAPDAVGRSEQGDQGEPPRSPTLCNDGKSSDFAAGANAPCAHSDLRPATKPEAKAKP